KYLKKFGVKNFTFDASLVRGLDYYTGTIFEAFSPEVKGSIAGGGRYDHLVELFSKVEIPATGGSVGLDRILEFLATKRMKTLVKVFVIPIAGINAIPVVQQLRKAGINTDLDLMERGVGKNLEFVSKQEIPFALLVGPEEQKKKKVKLRDMQTGKEQLLNLKQAIDKLNKTF
ncbi:MAG: ATP phosphoribosyltransferase regulatory subunit, partial [DPANN group archaeon]|nr:ATP phosphoribosyltransferase regulatory subunit [DPANN group archaeon]